MRLTAEIRYEADPTATFAMLLDTDFQERKCLANGALEHEVEVEEFDDGGATVTTRRAMPTDQVPDFIRTFVGQKMWVTEIQDWEAPTEGGHRSGTVVVEIDGAPVRFTGSLRLAADGSTGTVETIEGDLKASVPLIGRKIEDAAAPAIRSAIKVEQRTGTAWLAER